MSFSNMPSIRCTFLGKNLSPIQSPYLALIQRNNASWISQASCTNGLPPCSRVIETVFVVIEQPSFYNAFFRRPALDELDAFVSPKYLIVKFLTKKDWGTVKGEQFSLGELYFAIIDLYKKQHSAYFDTSINIQPSGEP